MKKFIIGGIAATAIIAAAVLNMNFSTKGDSFSDTFLANVEALAGGEEDHLYVWCCAPYTRVCLGNEHITVHGTLGKKPCK